MSDYIKFLLVRGVPGEAILLIEEQKVSEKYIYVGLVLNLRLISEFLLYSQN